VEDCPLEKRTWQSGPKKGKAFASMWHDCINCPFCLDKGYKRIVSRWFKKTYDIPVKVFCIGHRRHDFSELIAGLGRIKRKS